MAAYPLTTPSLFGGGVTGAGGDWGGKFRLPWFGGVDIGIGSGGVVVGPGGRDGAGGNVYPSPAPAPYLGSPVTTYPGVPSQPWLSQNKALVGLAAAAVVIIIVVSW